MGDTDVDSKPPSVQSCILQLPGLTVLLKSLCDDDVASHVSMVKEQLQKVAEQLDASKATSRVGLRSLQHVLIQWEQVRHTFQEQVRGYGQIFTGRVGQQTREQLKRNHVDSDLIVVLLDETVARLNAINETIERWERTGGFGDHQVSFRIISKDLFPSNNKNPILSTWNWISTKWNTFAGFILSYWNAPYQHRHSASSGHEVASAFVPEQDEQCEASSGSFEKDMRDLERKVDLTMDALSQIQDTLAKAKSKIEEIVQSWKHFDSQGKESLTDAVSDGLKQFLKSLATLSSGLL